MAGQEPYKELSLNQFRKFVMDIGIVQGGHVAKLKHPDGSRVIRPLILAEIVSHRHSACVGFSSHSLRRLFAPSLELLVHLAEIRIDAHTEGMIRRVTAYVFCVHRQSCLQRPTRRGRRTRSGMQQKVTRTRLTTAAR